MDWLPPEKRRKIMRSIRSKNSKPERTLGLGLFALGLRYRKHVKSLPGVPDFVFARFRAVVFVHGCFWHAHQCGAVARPTSNTEYWGPKLDRNVERDQAAQERLLADGWRVAVVWECAIPKEGSRELGDMLAQVAEWISSDVKKLELARTETASVRSRA
jgi:DNA mismatch endonuclease (patch repair protein)